MSKAKAIYAWWRGLSIWIRVPLSIVLVIALLALVVEGAIRLVRPARPSLYQPTTEARAAQDEHKQKLEATMEKIDKRYAEIKERIDNEQDTVRDFEKEVRAADSIDGVDAILAKRSGREQQERRDRREHND